MPFPDCDRAGGPADKQPLQINHPMVQAIAARGKGMSRKTRGTGAIVNHLIHQARQQTPLERMTGERRSRSNGGRREWRS